MRKLKLRVDDLEVLSFPTDSEPDARGTVEGYVTVPPTEGGPTCPPHASCDPYAHTCNGANSCACGTLYNTCYDGCESHYSGCPVCIID